LTGIRTLDRPARSLVAVLSTHSPWDDTSSPVTRDIHPVYETKKFIKTFKRAHHKSPFWAKWSQYTPSNPLFVYPVSYPSICA